MLPLLSHVVVRGKRINGNHVKFNWPDPVKIKNSRDPYIAKFYGLNKRAICSPSS